MSKASDFLDLLGEERGEGQGVGGPRQGDGGAATCKCPECGYTMTHDRGTPCTEIDCPKCGAKMVGTDTSESKNNTVTVTKGMSKVLSKSPKSNLVCTKCGFQVPRYKGRYPSTCPNCGTPLSILSRTEELIKVIED